MSTERIRRLEAIARRLEPTPEERRHLVRTVAAYADGFLDRIEHAPVFIADHDGGRGLYDAPLTDEPTDVVHLLDLVRRNVDGTSLNPASGGHMGYIPGGGVFPSALGDFLADVTNRYSGVYFANPGAVRMEHMLVRWMCDLVGYDNASGGDLTSGGSIASLASIVTARDAGALKARDFEKSVVYATTQMHHALDKSLRVAGLGECKVRRVDTDERFRMRPDRLQALIEEDARAGLRPWLVIISAGTTDTGAVDPIGSVGEIASRHRLWLHIDAAYGGFFLLTKEGARVLKAIDAGDSIVMDPHKGLFLPYGTGAVLVKDRSLLQAAHSYHANYMQDAKGAEDEYSPADHSLELTRHFRGLRMWLPLKLFGLAPFRACLEEKLLLARRFHERIQAIDGFEAGPPPELSVVTYRYVPKRGNADEFNQRLVREVQRDGRVFISSTRIDGRFILRLAVLAFRTHLDTIERALEVLEHTARRLERDA